MTSHNMYSVSMTKKALIIGGGIAGPVTAMALQQAGVEAVVYEAYDQGADGVGAFLTLAENGLAALRLIGLDGLIAGIDTPRFRMLNGNGKVLADMKGGGLTVKRAELYGVLRDEALRRGIGIEYGKRLVAATTARGVVTARFGDGSTAIGDLLVGADGLHSSTRKIIDPAAPDARYLGLMNTGGFAEGITVPGDPGTMHFMFGRKCFFGYLKDPAGGVWWFANPGRKRVPTEAITSDRWRAELLELFKDDAEPAVRIIEATPEIPACWATYDFPTVPKWHNDRMVIIGDAAHATSPSSGQGASMAIEDAVVLAKCLRDLPDTEQAFAAYEGLRRARVEKIVAQGKRNGSQKAPGPVGRVLRDLMLPPIMRQIAKRDPQRWMHEHRIDWDDKVK